MIYKNNICKNGGCVLKIDKKIGYNACFFLLGCFGAGRCKDTALTKQKSVYKLMKNITKRPEYKKKFKAIINLGDSFYDVDKFTEDIWNKTIVNCYKDLKIPMYVSLGNHEYDKFCPDILIKKFYENKDFDWILPSRYWANEHHIDNGDPRNIVFGIGNYKLDDFIEY